MQKLFKVSVLLVCCCIFFSGCSSKKSRDNRIEISIACVDSATDVGIKAIKKSISDFEKAHPEIKVTKYWLTKDYDTKLMTMLASGTDVGIFRVAPFYTPEFVKRDMLLPLDDYINQSKVIKLDDFFPLLLHKYRFDGKIIGKGPVYGFGTDWSPDFTLIYNKTIFDKEKIPVPANSYSWQEYLEVAKKLTKRDKNGMVTQYGCYVPDFELLVCQNGGKVFSDDGKKCLLDSKEAVGAMQFMIDLVLKYKVAPSVSEMKEQDTGTMFLTGKLAMFFIGRYYTAYLQSIIKNKFEWGVGPSMHNKKRVNLMWGPAGWVISNKTKNPKETWMLMEYLLVGEGARDMAKAGYNIPVLKKIAYSDDFLTNPDHKPGINKAFLDEVQYTIPTAINQYIEMRRYTEIVAKEVESGLIGNKTAEQVTKDIADKVNKIINENLKK